MWITFWALNVPTLNIAQDKLKLQIAQILRTAEPKVGIFAAPNDVAVYRQYFSDKEARLERDMSKTKHEPTVLGLCSRVLIQALVEIDFNHAYSDENYWRINSNEELQYYVKKYKIAYGKWLKRVVVGVDNDTIDYRKFTTTEINFVYTNSPVTALHNEERRVQWSALHRLFYNTLQKRRALRRQSYVQTLDEGDSDS